MEIHLQRPGRGSWGLGPWWLGLVPGVICVLVGILIVAVPQLLETLVASVFILIGVGLISVAWRMRPPAA